MRLYWIWLAELSGLQLWQKHILLRYFHDPEELYNAQSEAYAAVPDMTQAMVKALQDKDLSQARKILADCKEKHIFLITLQDAAYPRRLKNTRDAPLVLYGKGHLPDVEQTPVIAVVGTRKATPYGMNISRRMGAQIAACGGIVISGGAFGNDTMALQGALMTEQNVIAVLACGVDVIYPKPNAELFSLIEDQGCLLSEYPPGTPPYRWNFPVRNRILSGLSNGVLVVEAPKNSGALITAQLALEQGRDVFAVPGNIDVPTCEGSNALLQDRASAVLTGWDIMKEYAPLYPNVVRKQDPPTLVEELPFSSAKVSETVEIPRKSPTHTTKKRKSPIDKEENSSYSVISEALPPLSQEERDVLSLLTTAARPMDEIISEAGISSQKVLSLLTMLAVKGLVTHHPGGMVSLKNR